MLYDENLSRFSPKQEWKCYGCIEMRLNSRCSNSKTSSNSTDTKSGIKCCIVCHHPPPVDVMSELLHQGRICVEISLCVVPDAFTTICVCSEFSRLLPRIFPEVCILAVAQRVVRYVMLKVLLYHVDCDVSGPTKYKYQIQSVGRSHPSSLCSSDTWGWKDGLASDTPAFLQKFLHLYSFNLQSISWHKKPFLNTNVPPELHMGLLLMAVGLLVCWNLGNGQRR